MKGLGNRQNKSQVLKKKGRLKPIQPWYQQFLTTNKMDRYARHNTRGNKH